MISFTFTWVPPRLVINLPSAPKLVNTAAGPSFKYFPNTAAMEPGDSGLVPEVKLASRNPGNSRPFSLAARS